MRIFGAAPLAGGKDGSTVSQQAELVLEAPREVAGVIKTASSRSTGRTEVYAVRVRGSFKGEILRAVAELQLERQKAHARARKVTEGEVMELMLDAFKTARRNGVLVSHAVPVVDDVWRGVGEIARVLQVTPAEVVERLVVEKIAELGLLGRA